ncbi:MAG: ABC transporter substrate-binding protein [Candidatus Tectomicrobia bacterium]|nr:ABC transporter substrate-binding protein [Candidatus Tectomicrobia bacterium]
MGFKRARVTSLLVTAVVSLGLGAATATAEKLQFMADWIIGAKHAPLFLARDKGFWKKEGLEVSISRGYGSGSVAKLQNEGKTDFSFVDTGVIILGRPQGIRLKQAAVIHATYPIAWAGLRSNGIHSPKDLAGKVYGGSTGATSTLMFPLFARNAGLDPKQIKAINLDPTSWTPSFLAKKIDIIGVLTMVTLPVLRYSLKKKGLDPDKELAVFLGSDYGLDGYANGLTVRDDQIQKDPGLVRRFVRSSMAAFRRSVTHPDEALQNFLHKHPELNREIAAAQFDKMVESLLAPEARTLALGWMTEKKMTLTRDMMFEAYTLKAAKMPIGDIYTNEFLEKRPMKKGEIPAKYR